MISSIDPAPSVISCGGQSALFLSACPQGFQEIFQQGAKGPEKNRCITPAARNAICLIRYGPRSLVCLALAASFIVLAYGLTECRSSGLTAGPLILAQTQRQKFLEGRGAGRENLFPKRFPSPQAFLPSNFQASACRLQNKKSPAERGQKKTPSRCELQGGLERSLAAAYFPT